jgi:hypothetical protein
VNEPDTPSRPTFGANAAPDDIEFADVEFADEPEDLADEEEFDDQEDPGAADDDMDADDMDEVTKARLAAALADIDARFGRPPAEQVEAFTDAHQALQATLNRIDAV